MSVTLSLFCFSFTQTLTQFLEDKDMRGGGDTFNRFYPSVKCAIVSHVFYQAAKTL